MAAGRGHRWPALRTNQPQTVVSEGAANFATSVTLRLAKPPQSAPLPDWPICGQGWAGSKRTYLYKISCA